LTKHEQDLYETYTFLFERSSFSIQKKNTILTALMAGEPYSWRVIGISLKALEALAKHGYKYKTGLICRAHLVERLETAKRIFAKRLSQEDFFKQYETDETVIALKSENKKGGPLEFLRIDPKMGLFPNQLINFKHGKAERKYLRELHSKYQSGTVSMFRQATSVSEPVLEVASKRVFVGTIGKTKYLFNAENGRTVMALKSGARISDQAGEFILISRRQAAKGAVRLLHKQWRIARKEL
jgi:hypothetical protein